MPNVKVIAPQAPRKGSLRVAAYCRVSSDSRDQLHSYAAQIRAYTEEIALHDGWELIDVYADEGLTGTRMDKREDFNRMMADCRKGKIDRILVKSVSRFARNTKDCLSTLRELSGMGVSVKFEKENIDTKTLTTELLVSVFSSLAQQESISASANLHISYQHRMERGEFITCHAPFGYKLVDKKDLEVEPEEAAIVRWIFDSFLKGRSSRWIAEQLTKRGIPSQSGSGPWIRLMSECGFRIFESEEFGYFFGIDAAGFDFYEAFWCPLYKARGLHWHDDEAEHEYQMRRKGYAQKMYCGKLWWCNGGDPIEEVHQSA